MKVNRNDLSNFLSLMSLKGDIKNEELLLDVSKDSIISLTISKDLSTTVRGTLKGKYEDLGKICFANLPHFIKTINTHSQTDLDIVVSKNKIVMKDSELKSSSILTEEEYVRNTFSNDKFDGIRSKMSKDKISLSSIQISKIIKFFELNKSVKREENAVTFSITKNKLHLKFEGNSENTLEAEFELPNEVKDFNFKMGNVFVEVLMAINNAVDLYISENMIGIIIDNETTSFEFLVATSV